MPIAKLLEWVGSGVVGALAFAFLQHVLLPLAGNLLFHKAPKVSGRWRATIRARTPDGQHHDNSEVVFVRQIGNRVWGWTEIGAHPLFPALGAGNKFSGEIHGTTVTLTFQSRNAASPYRGVFIAVIESERVIRGLDIARHEAIWPIYGEFLLTKES